MKILLINPPLHNNKAVGDPLIFQPLGIAYIAATLEHDHDIRILDANVEGWNRVAKGGDQLGIGLTFAEIRERIVQASPDIVGVTIPFSTNAACSLEVAAIAKEVNPAIVTILGGPHPSVRPLETLNEKQVDYVVIGEGEATMVELVRAIETNDLAALPAIKGIGYKEGGEARLTPSRPMNNDLDTIPLPAHHLLPMQLYFDAFEGGAGARKDYVYHHRWASMITSRGCPYNCNFCSIHLSMGKKFRTRSIDNVMLEVQRLVEQYGVKHINFEDDNLTFRQERIHDMCQRILDRQYQFSWSTPNGIRADKLGEPLIRSMAESGCRRVFVAPESGVQHVVNNIIQKKMDLKDVEVSVKLFARYGVAVDGSFVMGLIGEKKSDIWGTILYAYKLKRLGMNRAGFHIATPLFGTRLYDEAIAKGYLTAQASAENMTTGVPQIETPEWTGRDLRRLQGIANWLVNYGPGQKLHALVRRWKDIFGFMSILVDYVVNGVRSRLDKASARS
ncbi:MAG: B12-binding domain-containing radical SAM protein [Magnetococcales bacterium]|nr:B12-binding domain-containing radical SAM protein [Magnetococcales bacterium]